MGFWSKGRAAGPDRRGSRVLADTHLADSRLLGEIQKEEQAGLALAFRARTIAVIIVALWLPFVVSGERTFYYLSLVALFFLLGLVPHLLRRWRHAEAVKYIFIFLDVVLVAAAVILQPPDEIASDWPIQMRVRSVEFLYLNLLLVGSALSYRPTNVLWTGASIIIVWAAGVLWLYQLPDTVRFDAAGGQDAAGILATVLDPRYVGLGAMLTQCVLTAIATGFLAVAVKRGRDMLLRQTRAEVARADLSRYVSPDVADAMLAEEGAEFGRPATRDVAVMFADICGFTTLVENLEPDRVVALLRAFQARMTAIVFRHGGTLDKYLGDGFMATFGALETERDADHPAQRALACALDLQREMDRWCEKRARRGAFPVRIGIGLHYGPAVVGNVGSEQRLEFTVVGDAANVAARIERLTRDFDCRIAVSADCLAAAQQGGHDLPAFANFGPTTLRGRAAPVQLHIWPVPAAN